VNQAFDSCPSDYYGRGIALYDRGLYAEAIAEFQRVLEASKGSTNPETRLASFYLGEAYANLGLAQARMNMYERAEESLRLALMLHPEYADLHFHLGVVYYRQGRYSQAEHEFVKATQINPSYARALMYLGLSRLFLGNESGLDDISKAAMLEPVYRDERYHTAIESYHSGDWPQALRLLESVAETDLDEVGYLLEKGKMLMNKEIYDEASQAFLEALSICPRYADIRNNLGLCYLRQGMTDMAIAQFLKALEINPRFVGARLNLALAYEAAGAHDKYIEELNRILQIEPGNPEAERRLSQIAGA